MVAALVRFAGILLDGWIIMLAAGAWHHEIAAAVPPLSYPQSVLVAATLTYLAFFLLAPLVTARKVAGS